MATRPMVDNDAAAELLAPFPVSCIGWFCLGYHISDRPGRAATIQALIVRSGLAPDGIATQDNVATTLNKILSRAPRVLTLHQQPYPDAMPAVSLAPADGSPLADFTSPWVP